jgi:hypothetical protein
MQARAWIAIVAALLAGCGGTVAREIYLPDGTKGFHINCDGSFATQADCFQKAGDVCAAKGYNIVNAQAGMGATRTLFIKCKE